MGRFYITTPIYYVNDEPHLGHAYTTIMADVFARYHRIAGDEVLFLTGTDEHGQKVAQAAKERGVDPQDHCDEMVERFRTLWATLNISCDDFIRTTEARHRRVVQQILQQLYEAGEIYPDDYEGWYCVPDERFWTEKDLVDGKCPECGREVVRISERNYFFRMGKYQAWLTDRIRNDPRFVLPASRRNEMLGFLRRPLNDLCISRPKARLSWGIPLPFDESYVCYVWFDALINYITAAGYCQNEEAFARWWPASCHLIGKDILTTHSIYWPTMLKAMGVEAPDTVMAHGWWLVDEEKMSKSLGNAIRPLDLADKYGVDAFRYFLVREMVLGMDSSFGETGFVHRYNSELANDLGNLLNRTVVMARRYLGGIVPQADLNHPDLSALKLQASKTLDGVTDALGELNPSGILDAIWDLVRQANRFAEVQAPWNLARDPNSRNTLKATLYGLLETMRYLAVLLFPVLPDKAEEIWAQIGADGDVKKQTMHGLQPWGRLRAGARLNAGSPIFPRIEPVEDDHSEKTDMDEGKGALVPFSEFQKLEFRVATVASAERVPGADRLLVLQVSLGDEQRQIVAGVAEQYRPESLVGRQIVVATNLEPATIRGVSSEGMLLAASADGRVALLQPDAEVPDGAEVG
ncbi:MAG: methionine--tRNA ligase [Gemmatimonadota bacterium]|nr:methionine--tRNA ligase [Gemmatimonadota bacterium]